MLRSRSTRIWVVLLLAYTAASALRFKDGRQKAEPYEPGRIAEALAQGHGFSYPAADQWFFLRRERDTTRFRPTAWQEPVWPAVMAGADRVFPDSGRARDALIGLRALLLIATAPALLLLARTLFGPRLGTATGVLAGTILILLEDVQDGVFSSIKSQYLLALEVVLACWLLVELRRRPTPARGAVLGALLGITALTGSVTMLMAPIAAAVLLQARKTALALLCAWVAVILPWSVRNYHVFGELVPIRTGFGLILMSGNPILGQTIAPEKGGCSGFERPVFAARGAWEAVERATAAGDAKRMDSRPVDCGARDPNGRYFSMNEAERDRYWGAAGWRFIAAEPGIAARLALAKPGHFFFRTGHHATAITLAALIGLALSLRTSSAVVVFLTALSQAVPYVLTIPYSYRYRYPLEPMLLLFGAYAIVVLGTRAGRMALPVLSGRGRPADQAGSALRRMWGRAPRTRGGPARARRTSGPD